MKSFLEGQRPCNLPIFSSLVLKVLHDTWVRVLVFVCLIPRKYLTLVSHMELLVSQGWVSFSLTRILSLTTESITLLLKSFVFPELTFSNGKTFNIFTWIQHKIYLPPFNMRYGPSEGCCCSLISGIWANAIACPGPEWLKVACVFREHWGDCTGSVGVKTSYIGDHSVWWKWRGMRETTQWLGSFSNSGLEMAWPRATTATTSWLGWGWGWYQGWGYCHNLPWDKDRSRDTVSGKWKGTDKGEIQMVGTRADTSSRVVAIMCRHQDEEDGGEGRKHSGSHQRGRWWQGQVAGGWMQASGGHVAGGAGSRGIGIGGTMGVLLFLGEFLLGEWTSAHFPTT